MISACKLIIFMEQLCFW